MTGARNRRLTPGLQSNRKLPCAASDASEFLTLPADTPLMFPRLATWRVCSIRQAPVDSRSVWRLSFAMEQKWRPDISEARVLKGVSPASDGTSEQIRNWYWSRFFATLDASPISGTDFLVELTSTESRPKRFPAQSLSKDMAKLCRQLTVSFGTLAQTIPLQLSHLGSMSH